MKGFGAARKFVYKTSELVYAGAVFSSAVLGVATSTELDAAWIKNSPIGVRVVELLQQNAINIYIVICTAVVASYFYRLRGDPWLWEKIKFILDEYQGKAFAKDPEDPSDHHRVTLFQHQKNCIFVKHWSATSIIRPWGKKSPFLIIWYRYCVQDIYLRNLPPCSMSPTQATIVKVSQPKPGLPTR